MNYPYQLSIVVPLYNEEESLPELVQWIKRVCTEHHLSFECILVDDGSKDRSWEIIQQLSQQFSEVKGIKFQRNYGKSAALNVGFAAAKGEVVITMDADLQDSPDELPALYSMIVNDGYDLVSGWKKKRHDPLSKTIPTKLFNWATRKMTKIQLNDFNCGLKAYKHNVVKSIEVFGEMHRYIPVLAQKAGFKKIGEKVVYHQERKFGVTKFGLDRFYKGFLDLLTVVFLSKFSKSPMHFFGLWGIFMFFIGFLSAGYIGVSKLYYLSQHIKAPLVTDNPYFYIALTCMVIGSQLFLAGFIGELVSRSSSDRNTYLIAEKLKLND
jgi:glycosyltransferase involved in cell wall biosynthesis